MDPSAPSASSSGRGAQPREGVIEHLVARALERSEELANEAIESICREHPEHAAAIREQIAALRAVGLLGVPSGGAGAKPTLSPVAPPPDDRTPAEPKSTEDFEPIGPYRPLKELGRGGQAVVYLAEDVRLHRPVALKILKGFGPVSEILLRRFRREAEVTSRLDHPGICPVYDAGMEKGIPYIAMRYLEGETLARKIERARRQTPQERRAEGAASSSGPSLGTTTKAEVSRLLALLEKAARALHAAHEAGVVHRDVKPGNILVTPLGEPVLLDFGLAGGEDGELSSLTRSGDLFGTPAYMSLEQLSGKRMRIDRRTDVYSLGVTLYECLTLRRPFEAPTREALYRAIQETDPPDPRRLNASISADLRVVLETALEKERDRRYQTALDFAEDLRRVREKEPIAAKPIGPVGRFVRRARRRPARAALLAALVLGVPLVAGLSGYILANLPEIEAQKRQALLDRVEHHLEEGFFRLGGDDHAASVQEFEEVLRLDPESPEALAGLSLAYLFRGLSQDALTLFERHGAAVKRTPDLERFRAAALRNLGRKEEAADVEKKIPSPSTALGFYFEGLAEYEQGLAGNQESFARARTLFSRAALTSPRARALYHFDLAQTVRGVKDEELARDVAASLTTLWPASPIAWYYASIALARAELEEWIEPMRKAIALKPDSALAYLDFAKGLRLEGILDEAEEAVRRAIALEPENPDSHTLLGNVLEERGALDAAIASYREAIRINPGFGHGVLGLAEALQKQGSEDEAFDLIRKAQDLKPFEAIARSTLGEMLRRKGRFEEAVTELRAAIALGLSNRQLGTANANLGAALFELRSLDESIEASRKAIELRPRLPGAHGNLGVALAFSGAFEEAEEHLRYAIAIRPEDPGHRFNLGSVLRMQGRYEEALAELRTAQELSSGGVGSKFPVDVDAFIREVEELLAREARLPEVLEGRFTPEDATEIASFATVCQAKGLFVDAARLWQRGFERDPSLAEQLDRAYRYSGACAAARAGFAGGAGSAGDPLGASWRGQARAWLRADLELRKRLLAEDASTGHEFGLKLRHWKSDPDLAGVRDDLGALPEAERESWAALWREVDELLASLK